MTTREQLLDEKKIFWTRFAFKEVLPKIKEITNQSNFGFHGLTHTEQVVLFGIDYALSEKVNPLPVILACALHDCARTNDAYDEMHGPNCLPIIKEFLKKHQFNLSQEEKEKIQKAVVLHTTGREAQDAVSACLWDADRTRLSWLWGYQESCFSTKRAKEVASLPSNGIKKYQEAQFLLLQKAQVPSFMLEEKKQKEGQFSFIRTFLER
ncbi:MAG: HD domain-containing protein [Alphaproteobacteria bacterium]|nr:HD domain-containing protein [Alphaproteobacteria bacterium]